MFNDPYLILSIIKLSRFNLNYFILLKNYNNKIDKYLLIYF